VSEIVERTYGNWRVPKSPGIAGLDLLGSVLLLGGVLTVIVTIMFAGLFPALGLLMILGLTLGMLTIKDRHGINGAQRIATRRGWRTAYKTRQHQYRSGPIGRVRHGACQLPGVLAPTKLTEFADSWGRPFAVLSLPTPGHYSITFSAQPEGGSLVDREQTDEWVARFGLALAQLGEEVGVIAAAVTIETVPDTGRELYQQVARRIDPNAPALARATLLEVTDRYPAGSAQTRAWITLVFASELDGKRLKVDEFANAVKPRVRALGESFHGSGVGLVQPLSAQELCETARIAFDPAVGELLEANRLDGVETPLRWSEVGPTGHQAGWDSYLHDSGLSVTWGMTIAPRGTVQSSVLTKLLAPSSRVARKRVTVIYRVIDPGDAATLVERDQRTAEFNLGTARRKSKSKIAEVEKADQTAKEQERGAGLVDFAMLVTATVDANDPDAKAIAEAAIDNLASTARITLRKLYGSQDSAFAASLPLGVLLPDYLRVPKLVQKATA
jgi:hypothetical protein